MHNFIRALVTFLPFTSASPYGVNPRDTTGCTSASLDDFSWTIDAFTYYSSEAYTTPAHEVASASIKFNLTNPALPEKVQCTASSSAYTIFFLGSINYSCTAPAGSKTKTTFNFSQIKNTLNVNQTWTCSDEDLESPVTFAGYGSVDLTLNCSSNFFQNPNWHSSSDGFYSLRTTTCTPVTLPLTPQNKTIVA
ncbi:hypothetical protein HD806DRAFT_491282 [Xylariaceae sp. AK1471]|nr:hypothetical protein HD806DRAFT_491282 [Xylariaceae sp. AK1471]